MAIRWNWGLVGFAASFLALGAACSSNRSGKSNVAAELSPRSKPAAKTLDKRELKRDLYRSAELLVRLGALEASVAVKNAQALASSNDLIMAFEGQPDPTLIERAVTRFRAEILLEQPVPTFIAVTDKNKKLIVLLRGRHVDSKVMPEMFQGASTPQSDVLSAALSRRLVSRSVWRHADDEAYHVAVAPIVDPEFDAPQGTVVLGYAISDEAQKRRSLVLGVDVAVIFKATITASSVPAERVSRKLLANAFEGKTELLPTREVGETVRVQIGSDEYLALGVKVPNRMVRGDTRLSLAQATTILFTRTSK